MQVEVLRAPIESVPLLGRLLHFYLYDLSEFAPIDMGVEGLFEYHWLDSYWKEDGRFPFLIYADGKVAGFVLVNRYSFSGNPVDHAVAECFVLRKFRRQGVGRIAANTILDQLPGTWEVAETQENLPAQAFWREIIQEYTGGDFQELLGSSKTWKGPIQRFDSRKRRNL